MLSRWFGRLKGGVDPAVDSIHRARARARGRARVCRTTDATHAHHTQPQAERIAAIAGVTSVEADARRFAPGTGASPRASDWLGGAEAPRNPVDCTVDDLPLGTGPFPEILPYWQRQVRREGGSPLTLTRLTPFVSWCCEAGRGSSPAGRRRPPALQRARQSRPRTHTRPSARRGARHRSHPPHPTSPPQTPRSRQTLGSSLTPPPPPAGAACWCAS